MLYNKFKDKKLSKLGLGGMRFPVKDGQLDQEIAEKIIDKSMEMGINYYDTAYSYQGGISELILSKTLAKYPRESYNFATKFPGHQIAETYYPEPIFENQLKKTKLEYFDFYLLHNIYENCYDVYMDPKWNILEYFLKQKEKGLIKHFGISTHARSDLFSTILKEFGPHIEFCQIELNYLDWTMQEAKYKCDLLKEYNIPVWVMEPLKGAQLLKLNDKSKDIMAQKHPDWSPAEWAFRYLMNMNDVKMILSGMASVSIVEENCNIFSEEKPFDKEDNEILMTVAESLKDNVPCTKCGYCRRVCPKELNIPLLMEQYNEMRYAPSNTVAMLMESIPVDKRPEACLKCGMCKRECPQFIDIPTCLEDLCKKLSTIPSWSEICKQRLSDAKKMHL